tara:strand:- start:1531 stop:1722 length:192 start_codon:yes stop_codon:yes gene_type:complete
MNVIEAIERLNKRYGELMIALEAIDDLLCSLGEIEGEPTDDLSGNTLEQIESEMQEIEDMIRY